MFSLQVIIGPGIAWNFLFKNKEVAEDAINGMVNDADLITIKDEFGTEGLFKRSEFHGCLLEDMELTKSAHLERIIHEQRLRAKAQQFIQNDPQLRSMQQSNSGIPVQMPMMR